MQMSETDIIGAVKIKDGLFIGDEYAAQVPNTTQYFLIVKFLFSLNIGFGICSD